MNTIEWNYFDRFNNAIERYMQPQGEGNTKASQLVTAINKLIYKWFNDGDVYDNTYYLDGWCNDLSSYANWIYNNYSEAQPILDRIDRAYTEEDYTMLLKELADRFLKESFLIGENEKATVGSIYNEKGKFKFEEYEEEEY